MLPQRLNRTTWSIWICSTVPNLIALRNRFVLGISCLWEDMLGTTERKSIVTNTSIDISANTLEWYTKLIIEYMDVLLDSSHCFVWNTFTFWWLLSVQSTNTYIFFMLHPYTNCAFGKMQSWHFYWWLSFYVFLCVSLCFTVFRPVIEQHGEDNITHSNI